MTSAIYKSKLKKNTVRTDFIENNVHGQYWRNLPLLVIYFSLFLIFRCRYGLKGRVFLKDTNGYVVSPSSLDKMGVEYVEGKPCYGILASLKLFRTVQ